MSPPAGCHAVRLFPPGGVFLPPPTTEAYAPPPGDAPGPPPGALSSLGAERLEWTELLGLVSNSIETITRVLAGAGRAAHVPRSECTRVRLAILSSLSGGVELAPSLDPGAARGHAFPAIDERLGVAPGEGLSVLEELCDLGLLTRELHNQVHVCPHCARCQINFRETCPSCASIDLETEPLIHHFHCAYSGLESEFARDLALECPRCGRSLHQLGQDFERPHEVYVCRACGDLFEEPRLFGQCLCCAHEFPGFEAVKHRIHRYRSTALAGRALELGRLTQLDMEGLLVDGRHRMDTRAFLGLELARELRRVERHGGAFSGAVLRFSHGGRPYPIFREWGTGPLAELGAVLRSSRSPLDLTARLGASAIAFLFPAADAEGLLAIRRRQDEHLASLALTTRDGAPLEVTWTDATWTDATWSEPATRLDEVRALFDLDGDIV